MDWTGVLQSPTFTIPEVSYGIIHIAGSLTFVTNMQTNIVGTLSFESTSFGNTIKSAGKHICNVIFDGTGGEWTLQDDANMNRGDGVEGGGLTISNGILNTNNKTVNTFHVYYGGGQFTLNMGSSVFNISAQWTGQNTQNLSLTQVHRLSI